MTLGAEAPQDVVRFAGRVYRPVAFVAIAQATTACGLAATIVVGNDVVTTVARIATGTDPGNRRGFRTWRAAVVSAAATGAQVAVDGAIAPVLAAVGIVHAVSCLWRGRGCPGHGQ